jgi:phosphoadenosine phosphosulfate reductase
MSAAERVRWAMDFLPSRALITSSFGAQSAVMLHLVTRIKPDIPVVLLDTGHLFEQTYAFVDRLRQQLKLNLHVYRAKLSPAWQQARFGKLWEQGVRGIEEYNRINKIEPMRRALSELGAGTWFSGLRRNQSASRADTRVLQLHADTVKVHPLVDWSDRDIHRYLKYHKLPYHPLWQKGYVSIGDTHTSRPLSIGDNPEDTRFFGQVRECGLHQPERYPTQTITG